MSFAEISLIGNVGKPPEIKSNPQGKEFCCFTVAVNENAGKDKQGNKIKETTWFNISCIGSLADVALEYVKKGEQVFLRGKLKATKYNGNHGMDVSLNIFATTIHLISNNKPTNESQSHDEEDNTDFNPEQYEQEIAASATENTADLSTVEAIESSKAKTKAKGK